MSRLAERRGLYLDGAVGLVTGASCGIGAVTAIELARRGTTLALVARRPAELDSTTRACAAAGGSAAAVVGDLSTDEGVREVTEAVHAAVGPIDLLVNNAGRHVFKPVVETAQENVDEMFDVNFFAAVSLTRAVLPGMLDRRCGSIVNLTSVTAYVPNPGEAAYGASKAALSMWSHSLAVDLHGTGVNVGVISPGPIDTETAGHADYYAGRRYPPSEVAREIVRMVEHGHVHRTAPRRFGVVAALYPVCGATLRALIGRQRSFMPAVAAR